ncbi:MBL fold metallo-hydrolase RNA specificity domain-containing protein [Ascidiimonas sp. W6]|uniref:MBL fold metallo-hydrolase RNA specificity domain-containing protein n=1 Tax=Ascidiimonas meishanensis TaxID=3128903 RepID=UPI0030EE496D
MDTKIRIHFLGGAGTVTGSKYLLETPEGNYMIDCGLFQGIKQLRVLNWKELPFPAKNIDMVLLTHGHLDHVGYLPCLVKQGFNGKIIGTGPTLAIARIILEDSAKIQEEEADNANKEGYSKHHPALPLYSEKDVANTISLFEVQPKDYDIELSANISFCFRQNGHILGSSYIEMKLFTKNFVFSGDLGRQKDPLLLAPERPKKADFLFIESTYGDRLHPKEDLETILISLVNEIIHKRGNLIIPSFAVERAQMLIYTLWKLYNKNKIPNIPVIVDTPMGIDVLDVFETYSNWHQLSNYEYQSMHQHVNLVSSYRETWEIIDDPRPKIIIAGSGMVTGGRVLTYIKQLGKKESTTILLVGYQAEGTRGRQLQEGIRELYIFGKYVEINAQVKHLHSLSAHADQKELLEWMSELRAAPQKIFLTHGEPGSADAFRVKIKDVYGWEATIPSLGEIITVKC